MQPAIYTGEKVVIKPARPGPSVSIIMPFEPKMMSKTQIHQRLKKAIEHTESQLLSRFPAYCTSVIRKLKAMLESLDYATHKKSVALFVSPGIEKVYYLDIMVGEKIIIDHSFEIRNIVLNKKMHRQFLLLILGQEKSRLMLGLEGNLVTLVINDSYRAGIRNDIAEKVANFSDPQHRKEVLIKKFLRRVDEGLTIVLKSYPYPLLVTCTPKIWGYFMGLSRNSEHVVEHIHGNYEESTEAELKTLIKPYLEDWDKIKEKDLLQQLERARDKNKCVFGMDSVFKSARQKRGRLLVVEKNYAFPAFMGPDDELNPVEEAVLNHSIYIKDAVDEVIEKVLANGGDVELVSDGLLKEYKRIALIQFY